MERPKYLARVSCQPNQLAKTNYGGLSCLMSQVHRLYTAISATNQFIHQTWPWQRRLYVGWFRLPVWPISS